MSISIMTALAIHNPKNDIRWGAGGPDEAGKFAGFIWLCHGGRLHCYLVSTESVYDSAEAAENAMESLVKEIREKNLTDITG